MEGAGGRAKVGMRQQWSFKDAQRVLETDMAGCTSAKEAMQGRSRQEHVIYVDFAGASHNTLFLHRLARNLAFLSNLVEEAADLCLTPSSCKRQSRLRASVPCSFLNDGCL